MLPLSTSCADHSDTIVSAAKSAPQFGATAAAFTGEWRGCPLTLAVCNMPNVIVAAESLRMS